MATETLRFDLLANDKASRVFSRLGGAVDDAEGKFSKLGRGMLAVGKVAAVGMAAGIGAGAVALTKFVGDARESERVTKLTAAIIKSTGGAAKVTAAQVGALSTSISNKTGVDDEAIQTGSNLLLTFKNVRNEVGKGNKVFNDATAAAVDLSAAGFGSIDSASKMLGKALNDPIAGLTALGRAGVTFTEQQKEQIKGFVESGDLLKAQKVILGEVQSQVGGAAEATGTAMDKLKTRLGNISEEIGARLLPHIDRAAEWLSNNLPGAFRKAEQLISPILGKIADAVPGIVEKIQTVVIPRLAEFRDFIASEVVPKLQSFVRWIRDELIPALERFANNVIPPAREAMGRLADAIDDIGDSFDNGKRKPGQFGDSIVGMLNLVGPLLAARFKTMSWEIAAISEAFQVLTANVRFFARTAVSLLDEFVGAFANTVTFILRGGAKMADALGMDSLAGKLRGAADKVEEFKWRVQAQMNALGSVGRRAGEDLGVGVAQGIAATSGMAEYQARQTVSRINAMMRQTADAHSPSRVTIQLGKDILEGLNIGMKEGAAAALAGAADLVEKVKGKLADLRSQATQLRTSTRDAVTGALDVGGLGTTTDAEGNTVAASITAQLASFAQQAQAFAGALRAAAAKGLNPSLIAKVAQLGPTNGLTAAQAIAAMDQAEVASANASLAMADKFAANLAQTVVTTTSLPEDIARQEARLRTLQEIRDDLRNRPQHIEFKIYDATDPDAVVAAIRKYIRKNGKLRDVAA